MKKINNVILCGGSGSRLWPLSKPKYPKQFVKIFDGKSLLQMTVERNAKVSDYQTIVVSEDLLYHAVNQIEELNLGADKVRFLCEPVAKNTYPAILLAAFHTDKDDYLFVTPSDHIIGPMDVYKDSVSRAVELAQDGKIVTFGIKPSFPHTGYGYIEASGTNISSFKEKPTKEVAKSYLEAGNYYWNGGMFCMKAGAFLDETKKINAMFFEDIKKVYDSINIENNIGKFSKEKMIPVESISIDYGCLEKTGIGAVVSCAFDWSDLGNYQSLAKYLKENSKRDFLYSDDESNFFFTNKKVVSFGVKNIIAYEDSEFFFIGDLNESEKVKDVYNAIKEKDPENIHSSLSDHRPWGSYDSPVDEDDYKVKVITVLPGKSLSLQKHKHRSEHWIVVKGEATVTVGEVRKNYSVNEHIFIPKTEVHRLENETNEEVKIIEVQLGSYLGEDDIERLEDKYGRN